MNGRPWNKLFAVLLVLMIVCASSCRTSDDDGSSDDHDNEDDDSGDNEMFVASAEARPYSIALGPAGAVFVAGRSYDEYYDAYEVCVGRLSPEGSIRWKNCLADAGYFGQSAMAVSPNREIFLVTVSCEDWVSNDSEPYRICEDDKLVTAKYLADGQQSWQSDSFIDESVTYLYPLGLALENQAAAFVALDLGIALCGVPYSPFGVPWERLHTMFPSPVDAHFEARGDLTSVGQDEDIDTGGPVIYVNRRSRDRFDESIWNASRSFSPDLNIPWGRTARLVVGADRDTTVVQSFYPGNESTSSCVLLRYDASGQEVWEVELADCSAADITADDAGHVYVFGNTTRDESTDCLIAKTDATGSPGWRKIISHDGPCDLHAATFDADGRLLVAGTVVAALDADGQVVWSRSFPHGEGGAVTTDADGNVYVVGGGEEAAAVAVVKYDHNGNELWVRGFDTDD